MNFNTSTSHFDYPGSDIVLRSCDSHNFHVPKLYLVNSSPVLRELIQSISNSSGFRRGPEPGRAALPVVKLPESGETLHSLLTFILPVVSILPSTSDKIMELLAVAQKYKMDSILAHIRCAMDPQFIRPDTALYIYFLAQKYGLHHDAVQAARATLCLPMALEELGDRLQFSEMTGAYLYELWKYHKRVRTDFQLGLRKARNSGLPEEVEDLDRITPSSVHSNKSRSGWLHNQVHNFIEAMNTRLIKQTLESKTCSCLDYSGDDPYEHILANRAVLTCVVHGVIKKAESTLTLVKEEPIPQNPDPLFAPLRLNLPDANIILRSSDRVNFRVHRSLLALSSPFFEDLLSLPQPPDAELVDGLPVVPLPEDSDLLNSLISLLYPIRSPIVPSSYEKVFALLAASQKYDMVSIQSNIRDLVKRGIFPAPVQAEAFSAYAIASRMGLSPEIEYAGSLTLGQPLTFDSLGEGLRSFTGQALCDLIRYRAANKVKSSGWFPSWS